MSKTTMEDARRVAAKYNVTLEFEEYFEEGTQIFGSIIIMTQEELDKLGISFDIDGFEHDMEMIGLFVARPGEWNRLTELIKERMEMKKTLKEGEK